MLIRALETCGRRGRVLLPLGLLAGFGLPWAAQPVRHLIPLCIFVLLTLAMLRLLSVRSKPVSQNHELGSSDTSVVDQPLMLDSSDTSLVDQTLMIDSSVSRVVEQRHRFPGPATKKIDRHHNVSWFSARVVDQEQKRVASVPGTLDSDQAGFFAGVFFTSVQTIRTGFSAFKATRPDILGWVVVSQCLLPLGLFLLGLSLQLDNAWLLPLILVATASPIAGSPSLVAMLGGDDSRTLRWLLIGSALLPCTAMPVFYLLFQQTDPWQLIKPSLLLLCLTGGALVLAVILHSALQRTKRQVSTLAIDGGSSTALAVMVIGLMSPLHVPAREGREAAGVVLDVAQAR